MMRPSKCKVNETKESNAHECHLLAETKDTCSGIKRCERGHQKMAEMKPWLDKTRGKIVHGNVCRSKDMDCQEDRTHHKPAPSAHKSKNSSKLRENSFHTHPRSGCRRGLVNLASVEAKSSALTTG